jgi:hypothetical protein
MGADDAINAAGKPRIIYLKSMIDGSPKSNSSGKMWEGSWGAGSQLLLLLLFIQVYCPYATLGYERPTPHL